MGKLRWTALALALVMLVTILPAFAAGAKSPGVQAYSQGDPYGGLAPWQNTSNRQPSRPAGEGDNGGLAPSPFEGSNQPSRPAGDGDYDGLAPAQKVGTSKPATRPAGSGDYGGLAPEESSVNQATRPAGPGDNGGVAPSPDLPEQATRPAGDGDYGGLAPTTFEGSNQPSRPAGDGDYGGLAPTQTTATKKKRDTSKLAQMEGQVLAGISLNTTSHTAYAYGSGGAFASFHPTRQVTRAEAAQMLFRLLPPDPPAVSGVIYTDVPENAWYAAAVKTMAALGVMEAKNGELNPGKEVSRGEFTRYIACFFPLRTDAELFDDVSEDDPNATFIRSARAWGWAQGGQDGRFHPDETINRAAAVVLLNRALGRTPDITYIQQNHPVFYTDVSPSSWYYYDVCEATVSHQYSDAGAESWTAHTAKTEVPKDGLHLVDGWLYYYDSARGDVVRSGSVGTFTFDANGHFTTGNAELDDWLHRIVLVRTDSSMTQEEMLRALYVYTRDSFTYLRRPPYEFGAHDFMETDALRILNTGYGNCYCYASLFWYLSRWIGYDSVIYSGTVGVRRSPHSWVEITMNGRNYIFDTELEMAYRRKKRFDVNLYKFYDAKNSWNYVRPKS